MEQLFSPIPGTYRHLLPAFQQEAFKTSLSIVRVGMWGYGLSLVVFALLIPWPYFQYPEIIWLDVLNALVCISCLVLSGRLRSAVQLHRLMFICALLILSSNARESMILGDFMSIFLISLTGAFLGIMMPWPPIYTILLSVATIFASLTMFTYWKPVFTGPFITLNLFSITSISFQLFLHAHRWENFLNRHRIGELNAELHAKNEQLREYNNQLEAELALARHVQQGLLPPPVPPWTGFDVACHSESALEIGGDFYSYHMFDHEHIALVVGDVSGKGVAAALLMATGMSLIRSALSLDLPPADRVALLDRNFMNYANSRRQNCALCYVEYRNGTLCVVNAGGIPPHVRRYNRTQGMCHQEGNEGDQRNGAEHGSDPQGGSVEIVDAGGAALGHGWGARDGYQEVSIALHPGDLVVLISDGVVEAVNNETGELFGFDRLRDAIAAGPTHSAQAMLSSLLEAIRTFTGQCTRARDDLTIVVFRVTKPIEADQQPAAPEPHEP